MICKNCGNIMNDNDKFCKSCGTPVPPQPQQNTYGYQQNQQNAYGYQQNAYGYQQNQQSAYGYQQNAYPAYQNRQPKPGVGFGEAVKRYFAGYTDFSGRARRSEYWYATLFVFLVNFVVNLILPDLSWILTLAFFLPSLALAVRRLHDVGKSGWFYLWGLLPLAGGIILLIQYCKDSEGENRFGPSTKY